MNSIFPSGSHFTRSPVLYIIPSSKGLFIKFLSVKSLLFKYPLDTPSPPTHNSPGIPIGHNLPETDTTYAVEFEIGFPIGIDVLYSLSIVKQQEKVVFSVGP